MRWIIAGCGERTRFEIQDPGSPGDPDAGYGSRGCVREDGSKAAYSIYTYCLRRTEHYHLRSLDWVERQVSLQGFNDRHTTRNLEI